MDKNIQELLLSIARNLENISEHEQDFSKQGYLQIIAQDIYTYLDTIEND